MPLQTTASWADGPFRLLTSPLAVIAKDDPKNDAFACLASNMSVVHNLIIRGLNSIYLQAPYVQLKDYKDFIGYASCFVPAAKGHHDGEEADFFPLIESHTGVSGLMNKEKEQHNQFHDGLEDMDKYLTGLRGREHEFDATKLNQIIDSFGNILVQHLKEELDALEALRIYGDKLKDINKWLDGNGEKAMKALTFTGGLPWCFLNHDVTYENGIWARWPYEAPFIIIIVGKHIASCWYWSWWKFASCDSAGRPQPLYAVPKAR